MTQLAFAVVLLCVMPVSVMMSIYSVRAESASLAQVSADEVVKRLAELGPHGIGGMAKSARSPREQLRRELYRRLMELGAAAVPALARGLEDSNFLIRRNVALFLSAGRRLLPELAPNFNVRKALPALPALVKALTDNDATVRAWAAQAIGQFGQDAAGAVPALVHLLANDDEGTRNSACIALRGIGPAAKDALPTLRKALSDSSADVRGFAKRAIERIERQ
jgi:HEAT repeat protein